MDSFYMSMAHDLAAKSNCVNRKVGAVLVTENKQNIVTSINDPYPNKTQCAEEGCLRAIQHIASGTAINTCRCIHCEARLISQCAKDGIATLNATVYTTLFPCSVCAKLLIDAGIKRIVYSQAYTDEYAIRILQAASIEIVHYDLFS